MNFDRKKKVKEMSWERQGNRCLWVLFLTNFKITAIIFFFLVCTNNSCNKFFFPSPSPFAELLQEFFFFALFLSCSLALFLILMYTNFYSYGWNVFTMCRWMLSHIVYIYECFLSSLFLASFQNNIPSCFERCVFFFLLLVEAACVLAIALLFHHHEGMEKKKLYMRVDGGEDSNNSFFFLLEV